MTRQLGMAWASCITKAKLTLPNLLRPKQQQIQNERLDGVRVKLRRRGDPASIARAAHFGQIVRRGKTFQLL